MPPIQTNVRTPAPLRVLALITVSALAAAASPAFADRLIRTLEARAPVGADQTVRIDFPIGKLVVEGGPGSEVVVEIEVRCDRKGSRTWCDDAAEKFEVRTVNGRDTVTVEFDGFRGILKGDSDIHLDGTIRVPADRPLRVDMNIGELEILGVRRDLDVDVNVGEVTIEVPGAAFRDADLDAGVGETSLRTPDGWVRGNRSMLVGSEVEWDGGPGQARLRADVGVGELKVRLTE